MSEKKQGRTPPAPGQQQQPRVVPLKNTPGHVRIDKSDHTERTPSTLQPVSPLPGAPPSKPPKSGA